MFDRKEFKRLVEKELKTDFFTPGHINRCFENLEKIKDSFFDEELVFAGIFLHSAGFPMSLKFNQDLVSTSMNLAKKILNESNFPKEKTEAVFHCIQEAGLKGQPKTIEAILVRDVNLLDEISAVGLIKEISVFSSRKISLRKFLEEQKSNSFLLKEAFLTDKAKTLSEEKISLFNSFIESLEKDLK